MTLDEIYAIVAENNGLDKAFVGKVYRAYWKALRQYIKSLPLKKDLTDEEFHQLRPNVNIPSIGKLHVSFDRYRRLHDNFKKHANYLKRNT